MNWKVPLSTFIDGKQYELDVESTVANNQWVVTLQSLARNDRDKILAEPLKIPFSLDKKMISYEPINMINRKVAPHIAEDLLKHQRYW